MNGKATILVTGGAGYIGTHTSVELLQSGYDVVVIDNLVNSKREAVRRIERVAGRAVHFVEADVRDAAVLDRVFEQHAITGVIHFAALKSVGESLTQPLTYYRNNVNGLTSVLDAMKRHGVRQFVFSSSATVYGDTETMPVQEHFPLSATNPYGESKLIAEQMLRDLAASDPAWRVAILRYFNPAGAHPSGLIGEDPRGEPTNLMPYIAQVAIGRRETLKVFGGDYPTPDGTGVRDYIHVVDLARGHLAALNALDRTGRSVTVNLGTGVGYSVVDAVKAFERASGRSIPYEIVARRPGDIAICYADATAAHHLLGWRAEYDLERMCADHWRWQQRNPDGFAAASTIIADAVATVTSGDDHPLAPARIAASA